MSLVDRLAGIGAIPDDPATAKIPVHYFYAALLEVHYGGVTVGDVESHFALNAAEQVELGVIVTKYTSLPANRREAFVNYLHALFMLAESGSPKHDTTVKLNARIQAFS